jgi:hypothetical protein
MPASAAHANLPDRVHMGDRPRHVQAALGSNTRRGATKQALGRLPMRNGSRQGIAQLCESANACIFNIYHTAPGDEKPQLAATFYGILSQVHFIELKELTINAF